MKLVTLTLNPAIDVTLFCDGTDDDRANRVISEIREAGGKGINVSKMANKFGVSVLSMGFAGKCDEEYFSLLSDSAGETAFIRVQGKIRENLTVRANDKCLKFNRRGFNINEDNISELVSLLQDKLEKGDLTAVSGSFPEGADCGMLIRIADQVKKAGSRLLLDTENCTLDIVSKIKPYFIKPNIHEFEKLFGVSNLSETEIPPMLLELYDRGIQNMFLTLGANGMFAMLSGRIYRVKNPKITPKSTVGAGDSTLSAFACGKIWDYEDEELLRFSSACGMATAATEGSGLATPETVKEYVNRISIEKI